MMCPSCHTRYDRELIPFTTVEHAKEIATEKLIEVQKQDHVYAVAMRKRLAAHDPPATDLVTRFQPSELYIYPSTTESESADVVRLDANHVLSARAPLASSPETGVVEQFPLTGSIVEAAREDPEQIPPVSWETIPDEPAPGECVRCSAPNTIESCTCMDCGEFFYTDEEAHTEGHPDGGFIVWVAAPIRVKDDMGTYVELECQNCGSQQFDVEFDTMCGYCSHMFAKMMDA